MKIRITDLLDEYLDDDLPLDAMPEILPGDRPKSQKPRHPSGKKRWAQVVAAVLIVASVSVAGGLRLWCGGGGKSLSAQKEAEGENPTAVAAEPTAEPIPEPTVEPEPTEDPANEETVLADGGYFNTTISVEGDVLNVSAGDVTRDGSAYQLKVILDTQVENVTGFLLEDYDCYLVLADGSTQTLSTSAETSYPENPFLKQETFTFDEGLSTSELETATLYLQIHTIMLMTTETTAIYTGQWDMGFSEAGVSVSTEVNQSSDDTQSLLPDQDFSITDLTVSESGCTFWLHTAADRFTLVPQGQLALAMQQDSEETFYGFSVLTDGSFGAESVTIDSTTMSTRGVTDTQNLVFCTVSWKETLEPTSITGLYFTDGTTGQTVEVTTYSY